MSVWNRVEKWPDRQEVITPSDSVNLAEPMVVYCGGSGNVVLVDKANTAVTYAVIAGQTLPVLAKRINATNTTATPLIGIF